MNNLVDTFCKYTQFCKANSPNIKKDLQTLVQIGESDMPDVAAEKLIRSRQVGKHVSIFGNAFHRVVYAAVEMAGQHHMGVLPNAKEKSLANYLLNFFDNPGTLASQVAHLVEIKNNIDNLALDKLATGTSVRMAFAGNFSTSTLVEARIHGMADADIDPMVDDSRMVSSRQLGKGKANSVFEVTYKDGNKFVFKPETAGRLGMTNLTLGRRGYAAQLQVAQINMAVQKTADTLGLGDIMVKTTVGSHQGNYGIFMEKAPGVSACDFTKYFDKAPEDGLSLKDVLRLPPEKYEKVVGQVMRQLNRLQWFDAITGQGDRHSNNYFVHVGKDLKVTVKAIDNDMSFSDYRIGLRTYRLVGEHAVNFRKRLKEAQTMIYPQEKGTIHLLPDPGVTATEDGYIVDSTKIQSPELHYCLNKSIGLHDCALPDAIDQGLFENLMKLKNGPAREEHLGQLRSRLSDEAFDAAVKRLDEAIAHAEKLQTEGKVFAPEDFEKHEIQKKILKNNSSLKLPERNHSAPLSTPEAKDAVKQYRKHNCDLFTRDLLLKLGKGKWFS